MLWYVGKQNKIRKEADILGSHIVSSLAFNDSVISVLNNSMSIKIDLGLMETKCSNNTDVFKATFSDFVAKSRVKLAISADAMTTGIKIGLDEVKLPRSE